MFFELGNALLDASIAVWDAKRFDDYVRPISAVRFLPTSCANARPSTRPTAGTLRRRAQKSRLRYQHQQKRLRTDVDRPQKPPDSARPSLRKSAFVTIHHSDSSPACSVQRVFAARLCILGGLFPMAAANRQPNRRGSTCLSRRRTTVIWLRPHKSLVGAIHYQDTDRGLFGLSHGQSSRFARIRSVTVLFMSTHNDRSTVAPMLRSSRPIGMGRRAGRHTQCVVLERLSSGILSRSQSERRTTRKCTSGQYRRAEGRTRSPRRL